MLLTIPSLMHRQVEFSNYCSSFAPSSFSFKCFPNSCDWICRSIAAEKDRAKVTFVDILSHTFIDYSSRFVERISESISHFGCDLESDVNQLPKRSAIAWARRI